MKILVLAYLMLSDHLRSGRVLPELILTLLVVAAVWVGQISPAVIALMTGVAALSLAAVVTHRFAGWANRSIGYMLIIRPLGRSGYLLGTILASWVLSVVVYVLLRVSTWPRLGNTLPELLRTSLPAVLALSLAVVLVTFLSPLVVGTEWLRTGFLVLLAMSVYREDLGQWHDVLYRILQAFWMTFAVPILGALNFSVSWEFYPPSALLLAVLAAETLLFLAAALALFRQRDLDWGS